MMEIEFTVNEPSNWLKGIADQFGVETKNNTIHIPPHLGEGFLRHYYLSNGLTLNYFHFRFVKEICFSRRAGKEMPISPIMFYIHESSAVQNINNEDKEINSKSPYGIFWPSSHISSEWQFPVSEWSSNITISVNHTQLLSRYLPKENFVHQLLSSGKPFYLFEEITPQMHHLIAELVAIINGEQHRHIPSLWIEGKTTELLALYFEKLIERPLTQNTARLNSTDVEKLFEVKSLLVENIGETPHLKDLATQIGFSETKLQKAFKQVFGKSIYQYALQEKMFLAQRMLKSKKLTVSEVGYELGYSNLSHFTKAFKKQFGLNPKTYSARQ